MDGRAFLVVARELVGGVTEAHWRAAAGRAYYALFLESRAALSRWGVRIPPRDPAHAAVRFRYTYAADADLRDIGTALDHLSQLRNQADYRLAPGGAFGNNAAADAACTEAANALALLDRVEAGAPRFAAAIADIRARWP